MILTLPLNRTSIRQKTLDRDFVGDYTFFVFWTITIISVCVEEMQTKNSPNSTFEHRDYPPRPDEARRRIQYSIDHNTTSLDLRCMGLASLPEEIFDLVELEQIFLRNNSLSKLPAEISHLKQLHLHSNVLTHLPEELDELHALEILNLPNNMLTGIPDSISNLRRLRHLDLSSNNIRFLPATLNELDSLKTLVIEGNDELDIPPELSSHNPKEILSFYFPGEGS